MKAPGKGVDAANELRGNINSSLPGAVLTSRSRSDLRKIIGIRAADGISGDAHVGASGARSVTSGVKQRFCIRFARIPARNF
jgi:hypothetical protein